jgi:putative DNA primase/helicase
MQTPMDTLVARPKAAQTNDIARLKGVHLVTASETEMNQHLSEALVKRLTGGDRIAARFLYSEFFEFTPKFKILLAVNHLPRIGGRDQGIWRRMEVAPFDVVIPPAERDHGLMERLLEEREGILRWAVEGAVEWYSHGLNPPAAVRRATEAYQTAEVATSRPRAYRSPNALGVREFIAESCTIGPGLACEVGDLFESYLEWFRRETASPLSLTAFGRTLTELGFGRDRKAPGGRTRRLGLALRRDEGFEQSANQTPSMAPSSSPPSSLTVQDPSAVQQEEGEDHGLS